MIDRTVQKYLTRYAEGESALCDAVDGAWSSVVVVPACREGDGLFATLRSLDAASAHGGGRALIVLVINARLNASKDTLAVNHTTQAALCAEAENVADGLWLKTQESSDVLLVDRTSDGRRFPVDQGVGLARKIGCDVALALWARQRLTAEWIRTTDADATVPLDYFQSTAEAHAMTLIMPFHHTVSGDDAFQEAIALYDIWLRYYVMGLGWAGSPYAFQTVGSTMAMRPKAYAQVRGFPRKQAAEDFYLLNKLAKVGRVHRHQGKPIVLHGRPSDRVPFGTGAGVTKIYQAHDELPFQLYEPRVFDCLRSWFQALNAFATHGRMETVQSQLLESGWTSSGLEILEGLGAFRILRDAVENTRSESACRRRLHTAFDAFKTLRTVHELRDHLWPNRPWREALAEAPFLSSLAWEGVESAVEVYRALADFEYEQEQGWSVGLSHK